MRWALPRVDAVQHLVDVGYKSASAAFRRWAPAEAQQSQVFRALA